MRVAAYQAPLLLAGCKDAIELICMQIRRCEIERIRILCCTEAILGGLVDNHPEPSRFAIAIHTKMLKNSAQTVLFIKICFFAGMVKLMSSNAIAIWLDFHLCSEPNIERIKNLDRALQCDPKILVALVS
jgi:hypothetical protein